MKCFFKCFNHQQIQNVFFLNLVKSYRIKSNSWKLHFKENIKVGIGMYQGKRCQIYLSTLWSSIISCCSATCTENSRDSSNPRVTFFSSSKMPQHLWRTSEQRHWRNKTHKGINTETNKLMFMCLLVSSNLIILPISLGHLWSSGLSRRLRQWGVSPPQDASISRWWTARWYVRFQRTEQPAA